MRREIADFMSKKEISKAIKKGYAEILVRDIIFKFSFNRKKAEAEIYKYDLNHNLYLQDLSFCETRTDFINYIYDKIN